MKNKTKKYRKPLGLLELDTLGLGGTLGSGILFVVLDEAVRWISTAGLKIMLMKNNQKI